MSNLRKEIGEYFDWQLCPYSEARQQVDEYTLAERLKSRGYCTEPYREYEQALTCPVNKRGEKNCLMSSCPSNTFCRLLRREGYIK
jgi:hypothetical protein